MLRSSRCGERVSRFEAKIRTSGVPTYAARLCDSRITVTQTQNSGGRSTISNQSPLAASMTLVICSRFNGKTTARRATIILGIALDGLERFLKSLLALLSAAWGGDSQTIRRGPDLARFLASRSSRDEALVARLPRYDPYIHNEGFHRQQWIAYRLQS